MVMVSRLAGKPVPESMLVNPMRLRLAYNNPAKCDVIFGTSGVRGNSLEGTFNRDHIRATVQAICDYRVEQGITGPLFMGMDTHVLSEPALETALQVFAANGVTVILNSKSPYTPTPAISFAILQYNKGRTFGLADGVVVTPSHNPPDAGGFKYNPTHGGPAGPSQTDVIQAKANKILENGCQQVKEFSLEQARAAETTIGQDLVVPYVQELGQIVNIDAIRGSGLRLAVDTMSGAGIHYWQFINEIHGLDIEIIRPDVDSLFSFMTVDHDGKVRMDCSSPWAMASLIGLRDRFDVAFGNDPDYDRHGIVTPQGLMNPNHYLAVAIEHLIKHRSFGDRQVGKTLVSSAIIDRVAGNRGSKVFEVPVGFKWFVDGLLDRSLLFGGEESAGASFPRINGEAWTTDKDGMIMDLLAAEITAVQGRNPQERYVELTEELGNPVYQRIDAPASLAQKAALKALSPDMVTASMLAGEAITAKLTHAPGNKAAIGGLKVTAKNGWFAARPSGTEDIYKIYGESFKGPEHLVQIQEEAQAIVGAAFTAAGV